MAIVNGPKLGLLYNCNIDEYYADNFRPFLQALDALIMANVINATTVVPPTSPNPGDAYLLVNTPSGAWTGKQNSIAVWSAQVTNTGTNVTNPQWVFYTPNAGWFVWNIATASQLVWNGSAWVSLAAGANFPVNTNITSMTGLTNQTINSSGYAYNDGTNSAINIGDNGTGSQIAYGSTTFGTGNGVIIGNQTWTGTGLSGPGIGVSNGGSTIAMANGGISASGTISGTTLQSVGNLIVYQQVQVGSGSVGNTGEIIARGSANTGLLLTGGGLTTLQSVVLINSGSGGSPVSGVGLLGFDTNYPTQTTVGAAGGASALPATPTGYLQVAIHGTVYAIPYYAHV